MQGDWQTNDEDEDEDEELDVVDDLDDVELDPEELDALDDVIEDDVDELPEDVGLEVLELDDDTEGPGALATDDELDVATFFPPVHAASKHTSNAEIVRRVMYISLSHLTEFGQLM